MTNEEFVRNIRILIFNLDKQGYYEEANELLKHIEAFENELNREYDTLLGAFDAIVGHYRKMGADI